MSPLLEPDDASAVHSYCLELHVRPARLGRQWSASLQGITPTGARVERRDFESLIDLMRFLEAMVAARGLR